MPRRYWQPHRPPQRPLFNPDVEIRRAGREGDWQRALMLRIRAGEIQRGRPYGSPRFNVMLAPAAVVICLLSLLPGMPGLGSTLLGGGVGLVVFFVLYIIGRGRLGAGDVKLAGVIGLMTGYPAVWSALVGGVILGAVAALILLLTKRANLKTTMAYAPYLAVGAIITIWSSMGPS